MLLLSVLKEAPKTEPNFKYSPHGTPRNCLYSDYATIHS